MRKLLYLALLCLPLVTHAADDEEEPLPDPVYYELSPSLVTNLTGGPKYIRCDVQLMVRGEENKEMLAKYAPALRHELFLLLAEQDGPTLQTPEGKEALRQAAVAALRMLMEKETKQPLIEDLYFTSYYVR